jgi:vinculin
MAREVGAREKELTNQIHRELLKQYLNEVKTLTPSFISSIKIYLTIKNYQQKQQQNRNLNGLVQAEKNRNYIIKIIIEKINEIIRILQLTTYDEDEWLNDDITIMKQLLVVNFYFYFFKTIIYFLLKNNFDSRLKHASEWLLDSNAIMNSVGEKSFKDSIDIAITLASKIQDKNQNEYIIAECEKLNNLFNGMYKFILEGKVCFYI